MLERTTRVNLLYDFYDVLLSSKQCELFELYHHDDWSLGEIADKYQVSRQGVYENVKRTEKSLEDFEDKLGLYKAYCDKELIAKQICTIIEESSLPVETKKELMQLVENLHMND